MKPDVPESNLPQKKGKGGPSEVEQTIALHKAMQMENDREVDYYTNPTILSRLVQNQKFAAALQRLENHGPAEAGIWVASKRRTKLAEQSTKKLQEPPAPQQDGDNNEPKNSAINPNSHKPELARGRTMDSFSTLTQSYVYQVEYQVEYTFRALPIHLACSFLGKVVDSGLHQDLEKLIAYLAVVYPEGCSRKDHDGHMPLHQAIWYNASPNTVSALLMAAPGAVQEKDVHGRYPIALNEHRTGEHKEAVRKLLKLKRKYWDMAREEAALRFKHRNVPSADQSITSTSVLAASHVDEETLMTTPSIFPGGAASSPSGKAASKVRAATGREQPVNSISWSQLEKRAILAEQKLEEVNEVAYYISKQAIELKAANKDLESKLETYTRTDLGKQVEQLKLEKEDLAWQVQRLHGLLLRNGIALDPDEEACFAKSPPLEVQAPRVSPVPAAAAAAQGEVENKTAKPFDVHTNAAKKSSAEQEQKRIKQQAAEIETLQKYISELRAKNEHYEEQLETNAFLLSSQLASRKMPAAWTDDESTVYPDDLSSVGVGIPTFSSSVGRGSNVMMSGIPEATTSTPSSPPASSQTASVPPSPYSLSRASSTPSQQSLTFHDMQILEEMNERVRQLVVQAENDASSTGSATHSYCDEQTEEQSYPEAEEQTTQTPRPPMAMESLSTRHVSEGDGKPIILPRPSLPQKRNKMKEEQVAAANSVAAYDVTSYVSGARPMSCATIQEDEEMSDPKVEAPSQEGTGQLVHRQPDGSFENAMITCNHHEDDLDSLLAEAIRLNGGRGFSPELMKLWQSTTSSLTEPSVDLSMLSLPVIQERIAQEREQNQKRQQWQPPQLHEQDPELEEGNSHGSGSTDTRGNKGSRQLNPVTSSPRPASPSGTTESETSTSEASNNMGMTNAYPSNHKVLGITKNSLVGDETVKHKKDSDYSKSTSTAPVDSMSTSDADELELLFSQAMNVEPVNHHHQKKKAPPKVAAASRPVMRTTTTANDGDAAGVDESDWWV